MKRLGNIILLIVLLVPDLQAGEITIKEKANQLLNSEIPTITKKKHKFSNSKHNYESLATYFWPNPDDAKASWVSYDGKKNPERLKYDGEKIDRFAEECSCLSDAFSQTHNMDYKKRWNKYIRTWFIKPTTRMYPNMEYAQIIVNRDNNHGQYYGIIDGYVFIKVIRSIETMETNDGIDAKTLQQLKNWFKQYAIWLQTSENGKLQADAPNNLSVAYDVMLCEFLAFSGDTAQAIQIGKEFPKKRLMSQIAADGSQTEELKRAKPISYSLYNLGHIYEFCAMQKRYGNHIYQDNKELLDKAIKYIEDVLNHPEQINETEKDDTAYNKKLLAYWKRLFKELL